MTLLMVIDNIFDRTVSLTFYTDFKSLYDGLFEINAMAEKIFLTDLSILCNCYKLRKLFLIVWISSLESLVDTMRKGDASLGLQKLLPENPLKFTANSLTKRESELVWVKSSDGKYPYKEVAPTMVWRAPVCGTHWLCCLHHSHWCNY